MKWSIELSGDPAIISVEVTGRVNLSLARNVLDEMWAAQAETGIHRVLWDVRAAAVPVFNADQLRALTRLHTEERPELPMAHAALLVKGDLSFGLGRMLVAFLTDTPVTVNVFREWEAAADWLRENGSESAPSTL